MGTAYHKQAERSRARPFEKGPEQCNQLKIASDGSDNSWSQIDLARSAIKANDQRFVYYTTAEAAIKIIRNREIWQRNAMMMNDCSAIAYSYSRIKSAFRDQAGTDFLYAAEGLFPDKVASQKLRTEPSESPRPINLEPSKCQCNSWIILGLKTN